MEDQQKHEYRWLTDCRSSPTKVADEMCFLVIEQLPGTNKACGCDHNNGNPEKDDGEPVVTAKRPRQPFQFNRRPASSEFAFAIVSTNRLNFSMTNPNAITAMPVRTQASRREAPCDRLPTSANDSQ